MPTVTRLREMARQIHSGILEYTTSLSSDQYLISQLFQTQSFAISIYSNQFKIKKDGGYNNRIYSEDKLNITDENIKTKVINATKYIG